MAFHALSFIYDGISSDTFGLVLCDFNASKGVKSNDTYKATIYSDKSSLAYRNSHYKTTVEKPLEMTLTIGSFEPIDALTRGYITAWLMGRQGYKQFRIIQDDYYNMFFNCIFTDQKTLTVNNMAYAFTVTAVCDSPFVYSPPVTKNFDLTSETNQISISNDSDVWDDYIYPEVSFTASGSTTSFSIINTSDANRVFSFSTLVPNERIFIDNENEIITSSLGLSKLEFFNKNWFRLIYGRNKLVVSGMGQLSITIPVLRKVGC